MQGLNSVHLIGFLGTDCEMRFTPNGTACTTLRVAVSDNRIGDDGNKIEKTEWFTIITFNKLAETCNQYLSKGDRVFVEGRFQTRSWDGQDGQKHWKTEVIASKVIFLEKKEELSKTNDTEVSND